MYPKLLLLLVSAAVAAPLSGSARSLAPLSGSARGPAQFARILNLQNEADTTGTFSYSYETENGIKAEARGVVNNAGVPNMEEQVVTGSFSFVSDNGQLYSVSYIADSNGFRAFGDHIPAAQPAPPVVPTPPRKEVPALPSSSRPRNEVDDLARWRSDLQGLTPPSPPPNLIFVPSIPHIPRHQDFLETII